MKFEKIKQNNLGLFDTYRLHVDDQPENSFVVGIGRDNDLLVIGGRYYATEGVIGLKVLSCTQDLFVLELAYAAELNGNTVTKIITRIINLVAMPSSVIAPSTLLNYNIYVSGLVDTAYKTNEDGTVHLEFLEIIAGFTVTPTTICINGNILFDCTDDQHKKVLVMQTPLGTSFNGTQVEGVSLSSDDIATIGHSHVIFKVPNEELILDFSLDSNGVIRYGERELKVKWM